MGTPAELRYPALAGEIAGSKIVKFTVVESDGPSRADQVASLSLFEATMLPHLDAAHNLAKWLLRHHEHDAEDVVQEAFLRAFRSFASLRGSNSRAWLLTIVRNTCYSFLKKRHATDVTTPFEEEIHTGDEQPVSPAEALQQTEERELVRDAIADLPAEFREIIVLRHQEDLSYNEIANILQIPPGTVMSRLARARGKLKEAIENRLGEGA